MTRFLATSSLRPLAALVFSMAGFSAAQAQFDLKTVLDNECQKVKNKEPYHLDLSTAFSDAGHQAWEFGSGQVDELITPDQLDQPIKPGEYAVPVIGYALMFGVPQPGPGQPCRLGRLEGPLASEITTLCSRGTLKSAAPDLLNGLIWRIEAGIPSKGLPSDGMTAVHELAPEIETALNHDYLSSVRDVDKPLHLFSWSTQRLIEDLDSLGPNGHAIADLYRVRGVLQNKRLKDYDLPGATLALFNANAQLALPKFDPQTDSPWAQVERGVFYPNRSSRRGLEQKLPRDSYRTWSR